MLVVLIVLIVMSYFFYRKTTLFSAAVVLFFPYLSSGIPGVKLVYIVSLMQIFFFYIKGYHLRKTNIPYSLWVIVPCVCAVLGYIISDRLGYSKNFPTIVVNCFCYFVYPYIVFQLVETKAHLQFFLKCIFTFFIVVCAYALVELFLGYNIYNQLVKQFHLLDPRAILGTEDVRQRFGFLRCNSIMPYSSALGMTCACMFFFFMYIRTIGYNVMQKKWDYFLIILLPFCVLLSGTRSQFLVFAIMILGLFFWKRFNQTLIFKKLLIVAGLLLIVASPFFLMIVDTIVNSNDSDTGGSSLNLRMRQLEICLSAIKYNPWFGNGRNFIWEEVRPENPLLFGAESVWFQLMVDYGFVGCLTYLSVVLGTSYWLYKTDKVLAIFPIGFLVGKTVSIVIGIELSFMLILSGIMVKACLLLKEEKEKV